MRIAVIGNGGREHAIASKLSKFHEVTWVRNALFPNSRNLNVVKESDLENMDLVIPGSEISILSLPDSLKSKVFAPTKKTAILETSKVYSSNFRKQFRIPSPETIPVTDVNSAIVNALKMKLKYGKVVIKEDGLAGGKGVYIESEHVVKRLETLYNEGKRYLTLEEYVPGEEFSAMAIVSGDVIIPLPLVKDYKKVYVNNLGPNTGGMGAVSADIPDLRNKILETILKPTVAGILKSQDLDPYVGILYAGIIMSPRGPLVLEYNVRFGDPECQVLLQHLKSDLGKIAYDAANFNLNPDSVEFRNIHATAVVLCSGGYPNSPELGQTISVNPCLMNTKETKLYLSSVNYEDNSFKVSGGRVANVVGVHENKLDSVRIAYENIHRVSFENSFYRDDIGLSNNF